MSTCDRFGGVSSALMVWLKKLTSDFPKTHLLMTPVRGMRGTGKVHRDGAGVLPGRNRLSICHPGK